MSEGRTILSLFDGMSCGQLALQIEGIKVKKYYASEIDKHAIKVTQANFPNTIQLGSVVDVDVSKLDRIDLLIGGSPCQSFSFAGKRKGMATKCEIEILSLDQYLQLKSEGFQFEGQSYLFWEYMRILTEVRKINPEVKFLLENVEMGEKWEKILSKAIGVNGIHINSALVSAQNRKRIYWTNIGTQPGGLFGYPVSIIQQPKDKGILLRDILEPEVDEKYFLSEKMLACLQSHQKFNKYTTENLNSESKSSCLSARLHKMGNADTYIKIDKTGNIKSNQDKASCFTAGGNSGGNHSDMDLIAITNKDNLVMQLNPSKESNGCQPYQQNRVYDSNGISPALMAQMSCGSHAILIPEATKKGYVEINPGECFDAENLKSTTRRGRKMDDKSNCLMAKETDFMQFTKDFRIRRLTPIECARLQTVPDNYFKDKDGNNIVSETQQYRQLGNGWTIDVIAHIFSYLK